MESTETEMNKFWDSYETDLCDALFGLWNSPAKPSFLHNRDEYNLARTILGCFDLNPRESKNVPELESNVFDASFIVSNGPFRFVGTKYLHQHLSVEGNDILVFTEWQKLAGLRHHAVLRSLSDFCMFFSNPVTLPTEPRQSAVVNWLLKEKKKYRS